MMGEGGGVVGMGCGGGQGWWCVAYWRCTKGCQINILQCTLEGVETVVGKYIRWKSVPLGYCSGKEAVFVVVVES